MKRNCICYRSEYHELYCLLENNHFILCVVGNEKLFHLAAINPLSSLSLSKLNPANLTSWSVDDVCYWLTQEGLGRFIEVFQDNAVDGECLLTLDNNLLKTDLGIIALGHRSRILKRVNELKKHVHPELHK